MRRVFTVLLICFITLSLAAQTKPAAKAAPAKPAQSEAATPARPKAIFNTSAGQINCTLFPDKAPMTVDNFIGLATGTKDWLNPVSKAKKHGVPLYDGTIFHRVIPNFMIQGGDPMGNGAGDPGYSFKDEFSDLRFDRPGRLAMANSGPNTNGSQFFITDVPTPHLNGRHTIFGQCDNIDVIKRIANVPRDPNDKPFRAIKITHITIVKPGQAAPVPKPATSVRPATAKPKQ